MDAIIIAMFINMINSWPLAVVVVAWLMLRADKK